MCVFVRNEQSPCVVWAFGWKTQYKVIFQLVVVAVVADAPAPAPPAVAVAAAASSSPSPLSPTPSSPLLAYSSNKGISLQSGSERAYCRILGVTPKSRYCVKKQWVGNFVSNQNRQTERAVEASHRPRKQAHCQAQTVSPRQGDAHAPHRLLLLHVGECFWYPLHHRQPRQNKSILRN